MVSELRINSGAFLKLLTAFEPQGLDRATLMAAAELDPSHVNDKDARIPIERLHLLWELVLARVCRRDAALLGASRYAPSDYGLVGFVAMNCETLGEALAQAIRFLALWTDDPQIRLDDGTLSLVDRGTFADRPGLRLAIEATLAELVQAARTATGQPIAPLAVHLTHPAPPDTAPFEEFFGTRVSFGQPANAVRFSGEQLALKLPRAEPALGEFLRGLAHDALAKRPTRDPSPLDRARRLIAEELQSGVPELPAIARRLAVSERTLRRRLAEEQTSFRALLDETRGELARGYVTDPRIPLTEVAFLLGFSDPSAFHRAFRRWTGATPAEFRRRGHS